MLFSIKPDVYTFGKNKKYPKVANTKSKNIESIHGRDRQNCTALMLTPMLHLVERVLTPSRRSDGGARTRKKLISS
jgi:hypothetical protein